MVNGKPRFGEFPHCPVWSVMYHGSVGFTPLSHVTLKPFSRDFMCVTTNIAQLKVYLSHFVSLTILYRVSSCSTTNMAMAMKFPLFLFFGITIQLVAGVSFPTCYICGSETSAVKEREADLMGSVTCGMLDDAGRFGFLTEDACEDVTKDAEGACGCVDLDEGVAATTAPPTFAPTAWTSVMEATPTIVQQASSPENCNICGKGYKMTNPLGVVNLAGGQFGSTCAAMDVFATGGMLDSICDVLPNYTTDCGCEPALLEVTTSTLSPTAAPTAVVDAVVSATVSDVLKSAEGSCNICGTGTVGNPSGIVNIDGTPFTCNTLNLAAINGFLTEGSCDELPSLAADACACTGVDVDVTTTFPTSSPTQAAVEAVDEDANGCSICGGGSMGNPSGLVVVDGTPFNCKTLQLAATNGFLPDDVCDDIMALSAEPCGCAAGISTPVVETTESPSLSPTQSPSSIPTNAPTANPTVSPTTLSPTLAETPSPTETPTVSSTVAAVEKADDGVCSICSSSTMTNPDGVVSINGSFFSCRTLNLAAKHGFLPEGSCEAVAALSQTSCGCEDYASVLTPQQDLNTDAPTDSPTAPPVAAPAGDDSCKICTSGSIGNPSGIVVIDGTSFSCQTLFLAASNGFLLEETCAGLSSVASEPCGCEDPELVVEPQNDTGLGPDSFVRPPKKSGVINSILGNTISLISGGNRRRQLRGGERVF